MRLNPLATFGIILSFIFLNACGDPWRTTLLLQTDEGFSSSAFKALMADNQKNYRIKKFDYLAIDVQANKGEILIDPYSDVPTGERYEPKNNTIEVKEKVVKYQVNEMGVLRLPMIDTIYVLGMSIAQVDSAIQKRYAKYYSDPYVKTRFLNKRITVFGGLSGGKVVNIEEENINLFEFLALVPEIAKESRFDAVKILRGYEEGNQQMMVVNMTDWNSYKSSETVLLPGDIVILDRYKKPQESVFTANSIIASITGIASLILTFIVLLNQNPGGG
ncbi:MAG: hypothetical protein EAZ57_00125 [Cytophagales bacterium]|nr:MAG: hypothetical protein EAZ67_04650 [Cytophagales bacterium]TAF62543.1 MAG: hypothetical protein EAZ57_00125 [Cytophagales bacterium]